MSENNFNTDFDTVQEKLLNAQEKIGFNPLEIWMKEIIEKKKADKDNNAKEQGEE